MAGTLNYDLRLNATQAERELAKLQGSLGKVNDLFGGLKSAIAGIGLGAFITSAIQSAAALDDMAKATGLALENVIGFSKAVKDFGGNAEGATTGLARFSNFVQDLADGNKKAQDNLYSLGLTLDDIRGKSDAEILRTTIRGLGEMTDKSKAVAIGMQIFGKSFSAVDFEDMNNNIDAYIEKALKIKGATKSAADAEEAFGKAVSALQSAVLQIIEPITSFIGSLKPESIQRFADAVVALTSFLIGLRVISGITTLITAYQVATLAATAANRGFIASLAISQFAKLAAAGSLIVDGLIGIKTAFQVAAGGATIFGLAISNILKGLLRFVPYVGAILIGLDLLGAGLEKLTGKGVVAWADEAGKALANLVGIEYKTSEEKKKIAEADEKLAEQRLKQAQASREIADALQKEKDALAQTLKSYQLSNEEANKRYQLDTRTISMTEKGKMAADAKFEAESKYNQEMLKLQSQLEEKKKSSSETDKRLVPEIEAAMGRLTTAYKEQVGGVDALVASRVKETNANQLKLFQTQAMIDSEQKLKDLQLQIANTGLPQLIQQYNTLDDAARKSAESAIAAEEARRKEKLSPEEVNAYYAAAKKGVDELKRSTEELAKAQEAYNLKQYGIKERIQLENDLQKIMNDTAKLTMNELQKKEYDILQSAKERAKAEIEAAEARRGSRLSAEEAQAYYDTAIAGTTELIAKQREAYFASRTFATGWRKALADFSDDATNAAKQAEQIFQRVTSGMEDMIVNFAKTGKFEFKGFINSILEDLLRSQVRQLMAQIFNIGGRQGSSGTGLFGSVGKLLGFANGGIIPTNSPVLVGERGPELISGAAGRNVTPNQDLGLGTTNVIYNINAVDAMSFKQMVAADPGFIYAVTQQGARGVPATRR